MMILGLLFGIFYLSTNISDEKSHFFSYYHF